MAAQIDVENGAGIARVTCGWKLPELDLADVRPYWRDVHSPAIARRAGLYEYRHYPLDPVREGLFGQVAGIEFACPADRNLMWISDVRYADQAGLEAFNSDPGPDERACILGDIDMIVDKSTTYLVLGENGKTLVDKTGDPAPAGPASSPLFQVFFRQRADQLAFHNAMRELAVRWAKIPGVLRVRLNLFEVPDMEAERKAGYPVKTHPAEMQYQAWIDLALEDDAVAKALVEANDAEQISTIHAYPTPAAYTFNYRGRPTLIGLRGFAALQAIRSLRADHHTAPRLLKWMYGEVVDDGPFA